ncbi:helix-turn-helix transcriptional regulator [Micromonospora sp. NPDC052213]|uniref:helix-turn-helix domain-containing protein n=1 Tax=Micromonospora sp. NPDC052213 TaxID=3155812 RepID=UPI0034374A2A
MCCLEPPSRCPQRARRGPEMPGITSSRRSVVAPALITTCRRYIYNRHCSAAFNRAGGVGEGGMLISGPPLRAARVKAGISMRGMARRTGTSYSHLSNVERSGRAATPAVVARGCGRPAR